jgi:hypothetical protein
MLSANDALVETLKNGKRRVTKKALREDGRFPHTKEFISAFIQEHPETIEQYRRELEERFRPADPLETSPSRSPVDLIAVNQGREFVPPHSHQLKRR